MKLLMLLYFLSISFFCCSQKQVSITFDDLPAALPKISLKHTIDVNKRLVAKVNAEQVPAIGFVNESMIDVFGEVEERVDILRMWRDHGLELGNHTYSHEDYNSLPFNKFEEELLKGEIYTKKVLQEKQKKIKYFRPPFLNMGSTPDTRKKLENLLKDNGYEIAPATVTNSDFIFNLIYLKAKIEGDTALMHTIGNSYIGFTSQRLDYYESVAAKIFRKDIPQIFLCHVNELNADYIDNILILFRSRGYEFISLDAALANPVFHQNDSYTGKDGVSWLLRWIPENQKEIIDQEPKVTPAIRNAYDLAQEEQFSFLLMPRVTGFNTAISIVLVGIMAIILILVVITVKARYNSIVKSR